MTNELTSYRLKFRSTLEPLIELLVFKKSELNQSEWIRFFESTKSSIFSNPDQFLGKDLPKSNLIQQIVEEIFDEIFEDQNIVV